MRFVCSKVRRGMKRINSKNLHCMLAFVILFVIKYLFAEQSLRIILKSTGTGK